MSDGKKFMSAETEYTVCSYGSLPQKVYMKRSHGVINLKTNKPVLNANDYKYPENIKGYGRCSACTHKIKMETEKNMSQADKRSCAASMQKRMPVNVDCTCVPVLKHAWQDCAEHYTIEGAPVLLEKSFLVCERRGRITFDLNIGKVDTKEIMEREQAAFDPLNKKLKQAGNVLEETLPSKIECDLKIGDNGRVYGKWESYFAKKTKRDVDIRELKMDKENSVSSEYSFEIGAEYDGTKVSGEQKNTIDKLSECKSKGSGKKVERKFKVENKEIGSTEIKYDVTGKKITLENKFDAFGKKTAKEVMDELDKKRGN